MMVRIFAQVGSGFDWISRVWSPELWVFKVGGGSYSTWCIAGIGGARASSKVRSMNGGVVRDSPLAISDHELIKWIAEVPSPKIWCKPTPRHTPPHLKKVAC